MEIYIYSINMEQEMSYQKYITVLLLAPLLGLVTCASSTRLYERWNDKDYAGEKLNKVLVLGLFQDDIQRRAFEAAFAKKVDSTGKNAVAGYTLMPDTADFDNKEDMKKNNLVVEFMRLGYS